jgi:hypothetical protein
MTAHVHNVTNIKTLVYTRRPGEENSFTRMSELSFNNLRKSLNQSIRSDGDGI